jgi:chorismate dehydratase
MASPSLQLTVGRIPFLVCAPYFFRSFSPSEGKISFLDGSPSEQNLRLASAKIHLAPSSSYAYAQNPDLFWILPDVCTGSTLEVRSVRLFSNVPLQELDQKSIHLTPQSATSSHLLKLLLGMWKKISPRWVESPWGTEPCAARLLIGDEALIESQANSWAYSYDLATLWQEWQGLPFVFGMWIVHHSAVDSPVLNPLLQEYRAGLIANVEEFRRDPVHALTDWLRVYPTSLSLEFLLQYYGVMDYRFTTEHKKSLELFYSLCAVAGLIERAPALRFLP